MNQSFLKFGLLFLLSCLPQILQARPTDMAPAASTSSADLVPAQQSDLQDNETWEPTDEMYKDLPYYLSGYDLKGRPVILLEIGRWNMGKYHSSGKEGLKDFQRYTDLFCHRLSPLSKTFNASHGVFLISNQDGLTLEQVSSPGVSESFASFTKEFYRLYNPAISDTVIVNANPTGYILLNIGESVASETLAAIGVFGPDKSLFVQRLLKDIPQDQLPESLGGTKNFKPAQVFGTTSTD